MEIIEPNTPWRNNATILSQKNLHKVPRDKIKKLLEDFDRLSDYKMLLEQCRKEVSDAKSSSPPRPKPGGFLSNYNEIYAKNDWAMPDCAFLEEEKPKQPKQPTTSFFADIEKKEIAKPPVVFTLEENTTLQPSKFVEIQASFTSHRSESNDEISFERIEESKLLLQSMFPKISDQIILEFLITYKNDVDTVTNILLDSVDLSDESQSHRHSEDTGIKPQPPPPPTSSSQTEQKKSAPTTTTTRCVKTLQEFYSEVMGELERSLEEHYNQNNESLSEVKQNSPESPQSLSPKSSKHSKNKNSGISNDKQSRGTGKKHSPEAAAASNKSKLVDYDDFDDDRSSESKTSALDSISVMTEDIDDESDEPILDLILNKSMLMSLIELFGDKSDLQYLKGKICALLVVDNF